MGNHNVKLNIFYSDGSIEFDAVWSFLDKTKKIVKLELEGYQSLQNKQTWFFSDAGVYSMSKGNMWVSRTIGGFDENGEGILVTVDCNNNCTIRFAKVEQLRKIFTKEAFYEI